MNRTQHSGMLGAQGTPAGSDFSSRTQASRQKETKTKQKDKTRGRSFSLQLPLPPRPLPHPGSLPTRRARCLPICPSEPFPELNERRQRRFFKGKAPENLINTIFRSPRGCGLPRRARLAAQGSTRWVWMPGCPAARGRRLGEGQRMPRLLRPGWRAVPRLGVRAVGPAGN